mmetsp:Transcript_14331/g.33272  ORF Transcript_14331/g.33272 Transcript_14331/m.33272 type:complete len:210 (-) Transcript_14331:300-929(-)
MKPTARVASRRRSCRGPRHMAASTCAAPFARSASLCCRREPARLQRRWVKKRKRAPTSVPSLLMAVRCFQRSYWSARVSFSFMTFWCSSSLSLSQISFMKFDTSFRIAATQSSSRAQCMRSDMSSERRVPDSVRQRYMILVFSVASTCRCAISIPSRYLDEVRIATLSFSRSLRPSISPSSLLRTPLYSRASSARARWYRCTSRLISSC